MEFDILILNVVNQRLNCYFHFMTKKQFVIRISGKVQGVWFRRSIKEIADRLGLKGLIQNEPDGTVKITVQGEDDDLSYFFTYCKEGPENAKVENIVIEEEIQFNNFGDFTIKRN